MRKQGPGVPTKHRRMLLWDSRAPEVDGEPVINLSDDTVFEFLCGEFYDSSPVSGDGGDRGLGEELETENEDGNQDAEGDDFWQTQHNLLQSTICRTTSLETRIRKITNQAVEEARESCGCCTAPPTGACRKCLMKDVCWRLRNAGFDSAICKSKWISSPEIPSGQHTFLDVVDNSNPKKGQVRVVIEFNFQAEFEIARSNDDYKKLVQRLPDTFVGKIERLLGVLKIMSTAAKKCMKDSKMHMGPWRKHRYMQAKWMKTCDRPSNSPNSFNYQISVPPGRPRMSMLTLDLNESLASLRRPAVQVV